MSVTLGRNDLCHCGSKKKYKKCHIEKDELADRKAREKAALNAAKVAEAEAEKNEKDPQAQVPGKAHKPQDQSGWVRKVAGKVGFFKNLTQRRTPSANKAG